MKCEEYDINIDNVLQYFTKEELLVIKRYNKLVEEEIKRLKEEKE